MIKRRKYKLFSILVSGVLVFSLVPTLKANALVEENNVIVNNIDDSDDIKVRDINTKSETTVTKSQYTKDVNGILPTTNDVIDENSTSAYIPKGLQVKQPKRGSIIGTDDRVKITNTKVFPYTAICYIQIVFPNNKTYIGTAWMYAKDVAVTAGHCVYSAADGGWAKSIEVVPACNGSTRPYGSTFSKQISAPKGWINKRSSDYDWGVIQLNDNIGDRTGYFGAYRTSKSLKGKNVDITGYPGEKSMTLWNMKGKIKSCTNRRVSYTIDTTGGQSGCPVYTNDYRAIAIHTTGSSKINGGTRISKALFDYIDTFRK